MSKSGIIRGGYLEPPSGKRIKLDTPKFFKWLDENKSFFFYPSLEVMGYWFTARKEHPVLVKKTKDSPTIYNKSKAYWSLYYRIDQQKLLKRYIGKSSDITLERLNEVAIALRSELLEFQRH